jgi:formamidopyrimidine-DNA glycosylase
MRTATAEKTATRRITKSAYNSDVPELPDILLYLYALRNRVVGHVVQHVRLASPFLLRSIDPPLSAMEGKTIVDLHRVGKRVVLEAEDELFLVFHLMIAGRFRWKPRGAKLPGKVGLLAIDFDNGTLVMTEAGTRRQASLHVVRGRGALAQHDPGGVQILDITLPEFAEALQAENHTLKRALTDPRVFSGIGNAYSDEILHAAMLSPFRQTQSLADADVRRLYDATRGTLTTWIDRLRTQAGDAFPEKMTAFHEEMAVHGKFGQPCPRCGSPVQRVVYASNEANYCATCQTGGRLLADRSLSRLLRDDWPKTIEELEKRRRG